MRKLLAFLILLLVLLAILDRVAVAGVEKEIATRATARYDLAAPPEVTVHGVPFLTQAVAGRYDEVEVKVGALNAAGVRLSGVDAVLYGVTAPLSDLVLRADQVEVRAERVVGTVVVPEATLNQRAPKGMKVDVSAAGLDVSGEITFLGQKVPAKARMKIELTGKGLRLAPEKVTLGGGITVPDPERFLRYEVPIGDLPFGLKFTEVTPVAGGLRITAEASDVPLQD
ncbi:LmeA family phospholipid-binding protein [Planomonospora parontospora]|uniref:LmeA family phospholipid-binding protein n=1 Tax=Planomonospora parontospora TaxID=58119 RepID=UPI0016710C4A|nr:DUF2993 domain-containing protein [Planomonospora parontospora]GGL23484.1 hypothetical protein GCM10014719_26560 [Planomonospora parontospora subsp. antibiotica]GII15020.1 hypothetical protein Ppa05_17460 [Planomonospora parontospora subsp. antibiotica]